MDKTVKVMTYNIHSGVGTDGKADWKRIADVIKGQDPDLLGLQEVARHRPTTPDLDPVPLFADYLKMDIHFAEAMAPENIWQYGNAAGSKNRSQVVDVIHFDIPEGEEPRVFIVVKALVNEQEYYFCTCHVPFDGEMANDTQIRVNCFKKLTEYLEKNQYIPAILTGDFNSFRGSAPIDYIHEHWDVVNDLNTDTPTAYCSQGAGWQQIDFICTYPKGAFEHKSITFVENMLASDHRPAVAELRYKN